MNPSIKDSSAAGCRCANRRCHRRDSDIDFAVTDTVALGVGAACRTSTIDLFLLFFFDLEAEVAGEAAGAVADAIGGAVFSDVYAVAAAVVFTTYRSLILVPEIDIPPGDIVNAPCPNVERAPVRSSCIMEKRETRYVGVYIASSLEPDTLTRPWWVASTVDSSPSFMRMLSYSFLKVMKLFLSLHMWCEAPESATHIGMAVAAAVRAVAVVRSASQWRGRSS